jgi:transcriptional regulator with XRE-family HTH domain
VPVAKTRRRTTRRRTYPTLRAYLQSTGDTQEHVAARVGCKQAQISRVVAGQRMPRPALALRLSRYARVPLDSFARVFYAASRRRALKRRGRRR